MKRVFFRFLAMVMGLIPLVSCSNEKDVDDLFKEGMTELTRTTMRKVASGEQSIYLERENYDWYMKDRNSSKWEKQEPYTWVGHSAVSPKAIYFENGCTWLPYQMVSDAYFNPLALPWKAYCKVTNQSKSLFIVNPIEFDESRGIVTINNREWTLLSIADDYFKMRVDYESGNWAYSPWEVDQKENTWLAVENKEITAYKIHHDYTLNKDELLLFDSEADLQRELIRMIREKLGNEFNLNEIFYPDVEYDDPIVNMDEVEKELFGE